ncbi:MAG: hypothetical protein AAB244_03680 [Nitrospirota bacterium]
MRHANRELGLKLERIGTLKRSEKIGKVCWLFSYCLMAMASKNPKMVFLELAKVTADLARKIGWTENIGERSIIDLIFNGDLFQVEIISTGEVIRGKKALSSLDWNGHYYIEIYPEYFPFVKYIRKWCVNEMREITSEIDTDQKGVAIPRKFKKAVGV